MRVGIDWLAKGAALDDVDCMYELGYISLWYLGDGSAALRWFKLAAAKNHGDSIYHCAKIYSRCIEGSLREQEACKNMEPNYRLAIKYYEQLISMYNNNKKYEDQIQLWKGMVNHLKLKIED